MLSDCRHPRFRNLKSTVHRISLSCSLIRSCMHLTVSPMYTLPYSQEESYTTLHLVFVDPQDPQLASKCDLSVVSDLKTYRTQYCCRQRRSGSYKPLMYGRTAVDLISVAGSLSDVYRFLDFVMLVTNKQEYPLETRTEVKCFFSSEVADGLVIIFFDRSYKHLTTRVYI